MRSVIAEDDKSKMIMYYNNGVSITALSKQFGYKRSTVGEFISRQKKKGLVNTSRQVGIIYKPKPKAVKRTNYKPKKPTNPNDLALYTEITNRYFEGETVETLSKSYKFSTQKIYKIIKIIHPEPRPRQRTRQRSEQSELILADIRNGMVQNDIARKYGVSRQLVSKIKQVYLNGEKWHKKSQSKKNKEPRLHFDVEDDIII